jgi:hypothetical protein
MSLPLPRIPLLPVGVCTASGHLSPPLTRIGQYLLAGMSRSVQLAAWAPSSFLSTSSEARLSLPRGLAGRFRTVRMQAGPDAGDEPYDYADAEPEKADRTQ